jgi:predicted nucleic acid-binding protein
MVVIDTDIFITALRGNAESAKHLSTLKGKAAVSIITELELFVGAKANFKSNK